MNQQIVRQPKRLHRSPILLLGPLIMLACMATSSSAQTSVLKLVDIKQDPPCSTWSDITSCSPKGGQIHWGASLKTDYTWTMPPDVIGPEGVTITLSVTENNPPDHKSATGIGMSSKDLVLDPVNPAVPIGAGNQPLSGNLKVTVKPPKNPSGDYYLKIGVFYGPGFIYHYRAEVSSKPSSKPSPKVDKSTRSSSRSLKNEVRAVAVTGDVFYHKGSTAPGALLPVDVDTVLKGTDEISTLPGSSVTLQFADGATTTTLKEDTQIRISEYFEEGGITRVEIKLQSGEVDSQVRQKYIDSIERPGWKMKVTEPVAVLSVRGTVFTARYDPKTQTSTTTVKEGVVEITPTNKSLPPVTLRAGQQVKVTPNRVGQVTSVRN